MINLHEFDEKLSLTAKISCEVLSFVLKCSLKEKLKGKVVYFRVLSS